MVSYSVSSVDSPPWLGRTASVKWVQQVHSDGNDGDGVPASKSWGKRPVKLHAKLQCLGDFDHLDGVAVPVARIGGGCV